MAYTVLEASKTPMTNNSRGFSMPSTGVFVAAVIRQTMVLGGSIITPSITYTNYM